MSKNQFRQPMRRSQRIQEHRSKTAVVCADGVQGHRRNYSISLNYNPYLTNWSSNIDPQQENNKTAQSSQPLLSSVQTNRQLRPTTEGEPDFIAEERAAWSKQSTQRRRRRARGDITSFELHEDSDASQAEDDRQEEVHIKEFAPSVDSQTRGRPTTRRGVGQQTKVPQSRTTSPGKISKFVEGSMHTRSSSVSSTWSRHSSAYESGGAETSDEDATPRASPRSSSIDIREFAPTFGTVSTIKKTLLRRGHKKSKAADPDDIVVRMDAHKTVRPSKKSIRKSLSTWSFHNIGEKLGISHGSAANCDDGDSQSYGRQGAAVDNTLDDRKRKAEAVYARLYGSKKQKDNQGLTTRFVAEDECESEPDLPFPTGSCLSKVDADATLKARSGNSMSRRRSFDPSDFDSMQRRMSTADHDIRKRPSRRELEKENQQLRAMLLEQQSTRTDLHESSTMRRRSGPPKDRNDVAAMPLDNDAPPIPALHPRRQQHRRPLSNVSNGRTPARCAGFDPSQDLENITKALLYKSLPSQSHTSSADRGIQPPIFVSADPITRQDQGVRASSSSIRSKRSVASLPVPMSAVLEHPDEDSYLDDASSASNTPLKESSTTDPVKPRAPEDVIKSSSADSTEAGDNIARSMLSPDPLRTSVAKKQSLMLHQNSPIDISAGEVTMDSRNGTKENGWEGWDEDVF